MILCCSLLGISEVVLSECECENVRASELALCSIAFGVGAGVVAVITPLSLNASLLKMQLLLLTLWKIRNLCFLMDLAFVLQPTASLRM